MKWIAYGPDAWLLQFADKLNDHAFARARAITRELEQRPPEGLIEFVPAFTSILLEFAQGSFDEAQRKELARRLKRARGVSMARVRAQEITVCYDGPDLERVAAQGRLEVEQVIERHWRPVYKVYAVGFSPGFPYLGDLDPALHTPRLPSPRARVPSGSVAIGGVHTGIYTVPGPGGWNLIGRTSARLFRWRAADLEESGTSPFLLHPGDRVKFVRVAELPREATT
jgi:KipI family sensor histidine kinase inhibitor